MTIKYKIGLNITDAGLDMLRRHVANEASLRPAVTPCAMITQRIINACHSGNPQIIISDPSEEQDMPL